jgi:haloacetate dehalogenase
MAADVVALMRHLGHAHFDVLAHDRGARVAHRLALDHPQTIKRLMLLDIAPTLDMYRATSEGFARAYWHWFFLIQPPPLPERLLQADPAAYVRGVMGARHAGLAAFDARALAEYERCAAAPGWAQAVCEDYRAAAGVDLEHDQASRDAGQKIACPLAVLWGEHGVVHRFFQPEPLWAAQAADLRLAKALPCGHYIAEEAPHALLDEALEFFRN